MSTQLMTREQESTPSAAALWALGAGEALSLSIGPGAREVHVAEGRLWLTREGTPQSPPEDIWLEAGDTIALDSGSQWVAPRASSCWCRRRPARRRARSALRPGSGFRLRWRPR